MTHTIYTHVTQDIGPLRLVKHTQTRDWVTLVTGRRIHHMDRWVYLPLPTSEVTPKSSAAALGLRAKIVLLTLSITELDASAKLRFGAPYGRVFCRVLWPWVSNSCTAPRGIEHYGNWVCRPTTSLRERWRRDKSRQELGYGAESRSIPVQSKPTTC